MSRAAVLIGRTTSDLLNNVLVVIIMSITGLIVGWSIHTGWAKGLAGYLLLLAFAYAMSWISALIGLSGKSVEVAQSAGFIWMFPLTFLSNAFVRRHHMPPVLKTIADWNPISRWCSSLRNCGATRLDAAAGIPGEYPIQLSIMWIALILIIFIPLSIARYRQAASR
jgi:ABC-type polysaccharide/polyol phosphate export permease